MLHYYSTKLGTLTIVQKSHIDDKPRKFKIEIREGNCLAVFLYIYKEEKPDDPKKPWVHQLVAWFNDEQHVKRVMRNYTKDAFAGLFSAVKIEKVKLNLYYKESKTLLKYMVRDGLKVECYYKEPNKK